MLRCPNRAAELRCIFRHAGQYLPPFSATKWGNVIPAIGLGRLFLDKVEQDIEHFHDLITSSTPSSSRHRHPTAPSSTRWALGGEQQHGASTGRRPGALHGWRRLLISLPASSHHADPSADPSAPQPAHSFWRAGTWLRRPARKVRAIQRRPQHSRPHCCWRR